MHAAQVPGGPCPVLGPDFRGSIGGVPLSTWVGGVVEHCSAPTTSQPCTELPPTCEPPFLGIGDAAPAPGERLRIEDDSRFIECDLGDALAPRSMTIASIDAGTVTLRWSHPRDLERLEVRAWIGAEVPPLEVPRVVDGDQLTVTVPAGNHTVSVHVWGDDGTKGCGLVPSRRSASYVASQPVVMPRP